MMHGTRYKNINCYELLGITPNSTMQQIKSAFRTVSMKTHPDVGGSNESQARVNYAYETLTDPIRRRLHDDFLISSHRYNQEALFKTEKDLKNSFNKTKIKRNIVDRVKKEVKRQADEIRSGHNNRYEEIFANNRDAFKKTRRVCIASISGVILSIIFGFLYPVIWLGILLSGYFLATNLKYRERGTAIFVFDSYWDIYVKKISKKQAKLETDTLIARLNEKIENIIKFVSIAKNPSMIKTGKNR
jgi:curved DNA-binding protein CbpA